MEEPFMPERLGGKSRNAMTSHCMISDDGARTFMVHWVKHDLVIICFLKRMVLPPKKAQICTRYWFIALDPVGLLLGHRRFVSFYKRNVAPHCNARFLNLGSHLLIPIFLFAMLVSILWFPPPSKTSWHDARESAESGGTIYLDLHRMDTLVTIRKNVDVIFVHMFDDPFVISKFEYFFTVFVYYFTVLSRDLIFIDDSDFPNLSFNYFTQTIVI